MCGRCGTFEAGFRFTRLRGSFMRKITAVMATAVMAAGIGFTAPALASAATAGAASTTAGAATSPVAWKTCADKDLAQAGAKCGYLSVPLNYSRPHGAK